MAYTVGRFWIEAMRTDDAHVIAGMRVNNWVSLLVFVGALIYFLRVRGPQEHVRILDDGKLQLVTAEGEPIEWKRRRPAAEVDAAAQPPDDPGGGDAEGERAPADESDDARAEKK
jgi:hypothetical protein